jgi:hypothetical protein
VAGRLSTARKFSVAYFALAALVGAVIGTFIVLVERPAPLPPPPWSAWRPVASDTLVRAQEIGTHIAAQYHLPSGKRLVRVVVGAPGTVGDPIRTVAIARTTHPTKQSDLLSLVDAKHSIMYILCGAGTKCSINEGKPSVARAAVLRREALELALYTFRYVKGTTSVVTFFPPKKGNNMSFALFFDRSSFTTQLGEPLRKTLPTTTPQISLTPAERKTVDLLTQRRVLYFVLERDASSGARVLVLAPKLG